MPICPRCGFETAGGSSACPLCGSALGAPAQREGGRAAWEDEAVPFPRNLLETWRESLFGPGAFFGRVAYEGSLARPLLYYLVISVASAFFTLWWEAVGWVPGRALLGDRSGAEALVNFFLSPFAALFGLAGWTLVLHLFVLLLAPSRRGLGATARVVCYSSGPMVLTAVPFLGAVVGGVWTLVLQVVGVRVAHRTTAGRAAAAVLLPLGGVLLLALLVVMLVVVVGLGFLEMYR